ncbi:carbonic anhydrase [Ponticaulis sp.]|uniref:carbonic anhydrase n=1 Tax=Ponticaulis sp. TaxID=2020902 RepID=UPI0025E9FFC3|nr:carbonic anhydrase [Ponticaulis sp.]
MLGFLKGVIKFQNEVYPSKQELFERLAKGQSPEAVFVACSDARVETAMITQTDPGELFILRNAGNIVPPHTSQTGGMTATIEFAMMVLNVPHIVVCGHSECGAMKGIMNPESVKHLPHVKEWLGFSQGAADIVEELAGDKSDDEKMRMLLEENVKLQLQHLRTHPSVMRKLARGDLTLHGWVYDIKTGQVDAWDEADGRFEPVDQRYAELAAQMASEMKCDH